MTFKKRQSATQETTLACTVCMSRNYTTTRSGTLKNEQKRLTLNKYCPTCQTHTEHQETK